MVDTNLSEIEGQTVGTPLDLTRDNSTAPTITAYTINIKINTIIHHLSQIDELKQNIIILTQGHVIPVLLHYVVLV